MCGQWVPQKLHKKMQAAMDLCKGDTGESANIPQKGENGNFALLVIHKWTKWHGFWWKREKQLFHSPSETAQKCIKQSRHTDAFPDHITPPCRPVPQYHVTTVLQTNCDINLPQRQWVNKYCKLYNSRGSEKFVVELFFLMISFEK